MRRIDGFVHAGDDNHRLLADLQFRTTAGCPFRTVQTDPARHPVVERERRHDHELGIGGEIGGTQRRSGHGSRRVAKALLRYAQRDTDIIPLRLNDGRPGRDFDEIRSRCGDEQILLGQIADLHARVAVLPFEIVRTDVRLMGIVRKVIAVAPPRPSGSEAVRGGRRRPQLDLRRTGLGHRRPERLVVALVFHAMKIAAESDLPVVPKPALQTERRLREGRTGG